jgi:hypothetical protein
MVSALKILGSKLLTHFFSFPTVAILCGWQLKKSDKEEKLYSPTFFISLTNSVTFCLFYPNILQAPHFAALLYYDLR